MIPGTLALLAVLAGAGEEYQPTDAFLRAYVAGTASYQIQAKFHEACPNSWHKPDAERYEAAVHCMLADERLGEVGRRALADVFLERLGSGEADTQERSRLVFVLARLRVATAVPALIEATRDEEEEIRWFAVEGLGLFGNRPCYDLNSQFAGRPVTVIFPPAPEARATAALLEFARGDSWARDDAIRALESHDTEEVEAFAREVALSGEGVGLSGPGDLLHALVRWRDADTLLEMAKEENAVIRAVAADAMSRQTDRRVVPVLLALLEDEDAVVRLDPEYSRRPTVSSGHRVRSLRQCSSSTHMGRLLRAPWFRTRCSTGNTGDRPWILGRKRVLVDSDATTIEARVALHE